VVGANNYSPLFFFIQPLAILNKSKIRKTNRKQIGAKIGAMQEKLQEKSQKKVSIRVRLIENKKCFFYN